ncbi:hypothetical protein BDY21DRAFT_13885 [Lineolata rhizophorae]|uniref:Uncharacterized protein n=1 Tax=Lineolata rhizophorae TaxID=578093 RepID=A0A6A6PEJ8_9PEZI|nr:hypothetical protein BDY21DRAFT_13885 [Lineolata rhizophorae]
MSSNPDKLRKFVGKAFGGSPGKSKGKEPVIVESPKTVLITNTKDRYGRALAKTFIHHGWNPIGIHVTLLSDKEYQDNHPWNTGKVENDGINEYYINMQESKIASQFDENFQNVKDELQDKGGVHAVIFCPPSTYPKLHLPYLNLACHGHA